MAPAVEEETDHRKMVRTKTPGIFKRGHRYVIVYRAGGRQRKEFARSMAEARALKAARQADVARGEFHAATRMTFREYAAEWVERYQGRGRGFRESTRDNYRGDLTRYAFPHFGERKRLADITPRDLSNFVAWLCDEKAQAAHTYDIAVAERAAREERGEKVGRRPVRTETKRLSDSTVRNIINPIRACLGTAVQEGLIRHNPAIRVHLPTREVVGDKIRGELEDDVRALNREQLAAVLSGIHPKYRLLFELLAATGLRISEAIALQWQHLHLDGGQPHVKVRRQIYRGRLQTPKSRHGRRDVPLSAALVSRLRGHHSQTEWPGAEDLVFPNEAGRPIYVENVRRRFLRPVAEEAGVPWVGFHSLRHTCASLLFERGANAKQVQRWLGHHSPAFTLDTYIHLLSDEMDNPLDLDHELDTGATLGATQATESPQSADAEELAELAA